MTDKPTISAPADWEAQFKTKQFCAAVVLFMLSEDVKAISLAFDPARGRMLWIFTKNGHKLHKEVAIRDIEGKSDSFDEIATRFGEHMVAKFKQIPAGKGIIIPPHSGSA